MGKYLLVTTTAGRAADARRIAAALVAERLAACVQVVGPVTSRFRWQGKVEVAREWLCLIKTSNGLYRRVEAEIGRLNPYDTPEIVALPMAHTSARYRAWLEESLGSVPRRRRG
jgi:periplasmic divalent cation tolerance protein